MLTILDAAGVRKDASGKPIGCGELVTVVNLPTIDDGNSSNVTLRGSCGQLAQLRPEPKISQGALFQPPVRELIVGAGAATPFPAVTPGEATNFRESDWTVGGTYTP